LAAKPILEEDFSKVPMRIRLLLNAYVYFFLSTVLVSSTKDTVCPFQNPTPALQRSSMIYDHNLYRSRVAQGLAIHNGGRKLPRGSNIYKVEWNCRLEKLASDAVNDCLTKKMDSSVYAQNYQFIETADDYDLTNPYPLAMERWIAPVLKKKFEDGAVTFKGRRRFAAVCK
ncbi:SCP-like protein, partial [Oesophagostomum dentatum]